MEKLLCPITDLLWDGVGVYLPKEKKKRFHSLSCLLIFVNSITFHHSLDKNGNYELWTTGKKTSYLYLFQGFSSCLLCNCHFSAHFPAAGRTAEGKRSVSLLLAFELRERISAKGPELQER